VSQKTVTIVEGGMTSAQDLADRVQRRWLEENPFAATLYGIPGYDDLVPDESEEGRRARRAEVGRFLDEAGVIAGEELTPANAVTLDCAREAAAQEREGIDLAAAEHTVTAMQYAGPAAFLAVAARTVLVDAAAAEAYLSRLGRSGAWLDQLAERLRTGARKGRLPVAPLAEQAVTWAEGVLAYLTGKLEILRIRGDARKRLGPAFSLPAFHGAVLDHGSLPMPALARSITGWLDRAG
jgi:uncharacterized protein (DUF885 family)